VQDRPPFEPLHDAAARDDRLGAHRQNTVYGLYRPPVSRTYELPGPSPDASEVPPVPSAAPPVPPPAPPSPNHTTVPSGSRTPIRSTVAVPCGFVESGSSVKTTSPVPRSNFTGS